MSRRFHKYGLLLLICAMFFAMGCDKVSTTVTAPTAVVTSTGAVTQSGFSVEPAALRPEFLPGFSCVSPRPFGTRIIILVGGGTDVILRGLRFRFIDRVGFTAFPQVVPIPGPSPLTAPPLTLPTSSPIPLPGVAPLPTTTITIPGASPMNGLFIPAGTPQSFPFFLTFGCGPFSDGTLFVTVDSGDRGGMMRTSELRVHLGS